MRSRKNYNSTLIEILGAKPIAFNPMLAKLGKSATAGLFLSQFLFWKGKGRDKEWVYKTIKEFEEETSLTRSEQDRAIRKWKELGVLEVEKRGIPQKRHFRIDYEKLLVLLDSQEKLPGNSAVHSAESSTLGCRGLQTITEITQKENTENLQTFLDKHKNNEIQMGRNRLVRNMSLKRR